MDHAVAQWLVSPQARKWIMQAERLPDPSSLAAGATMRRDLPSEQAAAILELVSLRRRGGTKLADRAASLFLTRDGLEQATRWEVARWRARGIVNTGARRVIDIGCGMGVDGLACLGEGIGEVIGIEIDPVAATLAEANWRGVGRARVIVADGEAIDLREWLHDPSTAIFLDPARRTARGRTWRVEDLRPSWEYVTSIISQAQGPVVVKLGPGFPHGLLPEDADVTWVSHRGDLVETTLWSSGVTTGAREAVMISHNEDHPTEQRLSRTTRTSPAGPLCRYLYEPDPAVIRAGATGALASLLNAHPVHDSIVYLTCDTTTPCVFACCFSIEETLTWSEKALRTWVRAHMVGTLEIKVRGLDVDPSELRRRLRPEGPHAATIVLTPTLEGAKALIVSRCAVGEALPGK